MDQSARVYVAGSQTFIGAAIASRLRDQGFTNVITDTYNGDLANAAYVESRFRSARPEFVFYTGGPSGGIHLNRTHPATLMRDNLLAATYTLDAAHRHGVQKLLYLASSCCYPTHCRQPMVETDLGSAPVEPTNYGYAAAKLAGINLCRAYHDEFGARFIPVVPATVYGPGEDMHSDTAHVVGALMTRMHDAKTRGDRSVKVWGTGEPIRDFLYVDDLADGCVACMERYDGVDPINIGSGCGVTITDLANTIAEVVGFQGERAFDSSKPDGMPEKVLDTSRITALAWQPRIGLLAGLRSTYEWYLAHRKAAERVAG